MEEVTVMGQGQTSSKQVMEQGNKALTAFALCANSAPCSGQANADPVKMKTQHVCELLKFTNTQAPLLKCVARCGFLVSLNSAIPCSAGSCWDLAFILHPLLALSPSHPSEHHLHHVTHIHLATTCPLPWPSANTCCVPIHCQ